MALLRCDVISGRSIVSSLLKLLLNFCTLCFCYNTVHHHKCPAWSISTRHRRSFMLFYSTVQVQTHWYFGGCYVDVSPDFYLWFRTSTRRVLSMQFFSRGSSSVCAVSCLEKRAVLFSKAAATLLTQCSSKSDHCFLQVVDHPDCRITMLGRIFKLLASS